MNKTSRILVAMLAVLVIATSVMLCACDNTPSEYKPKRFYGTYAKPLNEKYYLSYEKWFGDMQSSYEADVCTIASVGEDSYKYYNQNANAWLDKECDSELANEIKVLMDELNTTVTVQKNKIILNDTNIEIEYDKTAYLSDAIPEYVGGVAAFYNGKENVGIGFYENGIPAFVVAVRVSGILPASGDQYAITLSREFVH